MVLYTKKGDLGFVVLLFVVNDLLTVDGAVFGEMLVFAASPAQQDHNWLLCPLPVSL